MVGHGPIDHRLHGKGLTALGRTLMGIDWMTRDELVESIPPVYTEYIGKQLMKYLAKKTRYELAA